jgi:hypothetical protein
MRSGNIKSGRSPKKGVFSDLEFYIRDLLSKLNQKIYILTMIPPARNRNYSQILFLNSFGKHLYKNVLNLDTIF